MSKFFRTCNMRQFYEAWSNLLIWQPAATEMADQEKWQPAAAEIQSPLATKTENSIQQPLAGEMKEYDDGRCRHPRGHAPHTPLLRESITLTAAFTP